MGYFGTLSDIDCTILYLFQRSNQGHGNKKSIYLYQLVAEIDLTDVLMVISHA